MTAEGKGLLTTRQAADYLSVSSETLVRWRKIDPTASRYPRFLRLGDAGNSRVRYAVSDLDRWLEKRRRASTATAIAAGA